MDKSEKTKITVSEENTQNDISALLKAQEENKKQIELLIAQNTQLTEELTNLKTNTAEENALLSQQIADIKGEEAIPEYNPYAENLLYKVYNEIAGITTVMTGDEVKGIVGNIDKHLTAKLKKGEKEIVKHPYTITFDRVVKG
ncbi:MAG: hypothetical protein LUH11_03720 [Candidatus Gastranaerophilales bacterium]|nr:hypothetical protein [Candidatus Gastranaerophilales bacterium]